MYETLSCLFIFYIIHAHIQRVNFQQILIYFSYLIRKTVHIWKPQRKQVSMSFSTQICWSFLPIFNQKADIFVRNIGEHVGKGDFDLLHYSAACTLDIVLGKCLIKCKIYPKCRS